MTVEDYWGKQQSTFGLAVPMREVVLETVCDRCGVCWLEVLREEFNGFNGLAAIDVVFDETFECPWNGVALKVRTEPDRDRWEFWMECMVERQKYAKAWNWMDWDWKEAWDECE